MKPSLAERRRAHGFAELSDADRAENLDANIAELAAWSRYGQALIAALPPVDEDVERAIGKKLSAHYAKETRRKLLPRRAK